MGEEKLKNVFKFSFVYHKPGPFTSVGVLKTKEGLIALIVYFLTGGFNNYLVARVEENFTLDTPFLLMMLFSILLSTLAMAFASTSPLKNSISLAFRKYFHYLAYTLLYLAIVLALIGLMIILTLVGFYLGLALGIALLFYGVYRIFLTPGLIACRDFSVGDAISESLRLTTRWRALDFFIIYFIVLLVVEEIDKYLFNLFMMTGNIIALIATFIFNIPMFLITASITIYAHYLEERKIAALSE